MMKINLKGLKNGEHFILFRHTFKDLGVGRTTFPDEVEVKVSIDKRGMNYYTKLLINTNALSECDRCLCEVKRPVEADFFVVYTEDAGLVGEEESDDLRFVPASGEDIDLTEDVIQTLKLSLSMKVLCKESCKGLCSKCGADLNRETCSCAKEGIDPRWEKLQELL